MAPDTVQADLRPAVKSYYHLVIGDLSLCRSGVVIESGGYPPSHPCPANGSCFQNFLPILTLDWTVSLASKGWTLELAPSEEIASISTTTVATPSPTCPLFWRWLDLFIFLDPSSFKDILQHKCIEPILWDTFWTEMTIVEWASVFIWSMQRCPVVMVNASDGAQRAQLFSTWCCSHRSQHIAGWVRCVQFWRWTVAGIDLLQPAQRK